MANQTDVKGTFTFEQGFYDRNAELIEDYFENAELANEYGITWISSCGAGEFQFEAYGKWSFVQNLAWCFVPVEESPKNIVDQFHELFVRMLEAKTKVKFDYAEFDPDMKTLKHTTVSVYPATQCDHTNPFWFSISSDLKTEDLPHDEHALIDSGFETGILLDDDSEDIPWSGISKLKNEIAPKITQLLTDKGIYPTDYPASKISKKLCNYILTDSKYRGGILDTHFEDEDSINDWIANDLINVL